MILGLWHAGHIKLSELVTQRYSLDEINDGYQDMMDGMNIRGVIIHEH
jgi:S-(hydroxymethyl)glutathione dehydrogenase/alcohol dehydrogenase